MTIATAIVFSHRFFLRQSHAKNDRRVCLLMLFYCVFFLFHMPYCVGCTLLFQVPWFLCFFAGVGIFVFINSSAYVRLVLIFKLFSVISYWKVLILAAHQNFLLYNNEWMLWNFHILFRSHFFFITCQFFIFCLSIIVGKIIHISK